VWGERLAELRDVVLQRVGGCPGRLSAPERVDEPVCRNDLVRTREKEGEERPLPCPAERERAGPLDNLERSEDAKLHVVLLSAAVLLCGGDANTLSPAQLRLSDTSGRSPTVSPDREAA